MVWYMSCEQYKEFLMVTVYQYNEYMYYNYIHSSLVKHMHVECRNMSIYMYCNYTSLLHTLLDEVPLQSTVVYTIIFLE